MAGRDVPTVRAAAIQRFPDTGLEIERFDRAAVKAATRRRVRRENDDVVPGDELRPAVRDFATRRIQRRQGLELAARPACATSRR
jgi:hypothetical protein